MEKEGAPWRFRGAPLLLAVPMAPGISWAPVTPSQLPMLRGLGVPCGRPSTRAPREGGSRPGGAGSGQLLFCRGSGGSYHPWGARPVSPAVASGPPSLRVRRGLLPRGCCGDMRIPGAFVSAWGGGGRKTLVAAQATPSVSGPSLKAGPRLPPSVEYRRPLCQEPTVCPPCWAAAALGVAEPSPREK